MVGQSEQMIKRALEVVKANPNSIVMLDELEKMLGGVGKAQVGDGGTTKRATAQLLKFLSEDRPEGLYVIATCNDVSSLPPEWLRSERWDGIFYIGLPNEEERQAILDYYKNKFAVEGEAPNTDGWSGAEIKTLCRQAAMLNCSLQEASKFVIPISKTMEREIAELEKWAVGRTIPASTKIEKSITKNRNVEI